MHPIPSQLLFEELSNPYPPLCDHCAGGGAFVPPGGWKNTNSLVVARQTMDSGFDENQAKFGVLVLSIAFEMLADSHCLKIDI